MPQNAARLSPPSRTLRATAACSGSAAVLPSTMLPQDASSGRLPSNSSRLKPIGTARNAKALAGGSGALRRMRASRLASANAAASVAAAPCVSEKTSAGRLGMAQSVACGSAAQARPATMAASRHRSRARLRLERPIASSPASANAAQASRAGYRKPVWVRSPRPNQTMQAVASTQATAERSRRSGMCGSSRPRIPKGDSSEFMAVPEDRHGADQRIAGAAPEIVVVSILSAAMTRLMTFIGRRAAPHRGARIDAIRH